MLLFYTGWRQIQSIVVGKPEEIITVQEIIKGKKFKIIIFEEKYILEDFRLLDQLLAFKNTRLMLDDITQFSSKVAIGSNMLSFSRV